MAKAMILVSVLLLGWTWTLQGVPVQEDADAVDQPIQVKSAVEPPVTPADVEGLNATLSVVRLFNRTLFNATEDCKKAPETGPCRAYVENYFYNSTSMSCEVFIYGGCGGNLNNFEDQAECMRRCHTEDKEHSAALVPLLL